MKDDLPYSFYSKDSAEYSSTPNDVDSEEHFGGVQICYGMFDKLPDYPHARLPGYQFTRLPGNQVTRLPVYHVTKLPGYPQSKLLGYQFTR